MSTLIKNAHLISPDVDVRNAAVELDGGLVKKIYQPGESLPACDEVYDAEGRMVMPGFIDVHIHGGMGCDATGDDPDSVRVIAEAKIKEGVTSFCPTTLTLPEERLVSSLEHIEKYRKNPSGCKVLGTHLEGPYINPSCCGAQNPAYLRKPNIEEVKRLNDISPVSLISYAAELEGAPEFTAELCKMGICPSCGHTAATMADFKACQKKGLHHLTHFCNQMTKLHHREIGMVGAGLYEDEVAIEMICDKIHLCPDMIRLAFKVKPIDKILLITDAMEATGLPDGDYQLGGLAVVVADGAARLKSNGALAGSTLQFNRALKNVYEETGLPLKDLIKTCAWNQVRDFGLEKLGKIEPGYAADIAVLDDQFNVQAVFVDGCRKL